MNKPTISFEEVRKAIAEKRQRMQAAFEEAVRSGRNIPVTPEELAQLEELCTVRTQPARPTSAPATEWTWIRG
jgi:hypothetical protein